MSVTIPKGVKELLPSMALRNGYRVLVERVRDGAVGIQQSGGPAEIIVVSRVMWDKMVEGDDGQQDV